MPTFLSLHIDQILVKDRIREDLGEVEALAESIRDNGQLQPLVVDVPSGDPAFPVALRCGGRRYTALTLLKLNKVPGGKPEQWEQVPCMVFQDLPPEQKVLIELEENFRRKSMTWQENVRGIVRYHKLKKREATLAGDTWTQSMTGELLNVGQSDVSIAFHVHKYLNDERVKAAENLFNAVQIIAGIELDLAQAEQLRRLRILQSNSPAKTDGPGNASPAGSPVGPTVLLSNGGTVNPGTLPAGAPAGDVQPAVPAPSGREKYLAFYRQGDCLVELPKLAETITINHIITDPPYAIDMEFFTGENISRVADTHEVQENLKLIPEFLSVAFKVLASDGFLAMWYDLDHHEKIGEWARKIGYRVQRWPFIWCKTSACVNSQAQYNFTKASEVCYILRKSEQSILKSKRSTNFILAPNERNATHPFVKPNAVWSPLVDSLSLPNQNIVDPFAGEGSALAAIFKRGRNPFGIELDDKHIASGLSYIETELAKKEVNLNDFLAEPSF